MGASGKKTLEGWACSWTLLPPQLLWFSVNAPCVGKAFSILLSEQPHLWLRWFVSFYKKDLSFTKANYFHIVFSFYTNFRPRCFRCGEESSLSCLGDNWRLAWEVENVTSSLWYDILGQMTNSLNDIPNVRCCKDSLPLLSVKTAGRKISFYFKKKNDEGEKSKLCLKLFPCMINTWTVFRKWHVFLLL